LTAPDWHHRVNRLEAGLERLLHRLAVDDAGRQALDRGKLLRPDRSFAVDRLPERIHDPAEQLVADRHRDDPPRTLHLIAFFDFLELAEEHRAHAVLLEVQGDAEHAVRKLEHLAGHGVLDPVYSG